MPIFHRLVCGVGLTLWSAAAWAAGPEYLLKLRDGTTRPINQLEFRADAMACRDPESSAIPYHDIISLRRSDYQNDWTERTSIIWLSNGDRIVGEPLEIRDDVLAVRWLNFPASKELSIPLEYVAAITLQTPATLADRQKLLGQIAIEKEVGDVAWLVSGDKVAGEFQEFQRGEFLLTTAAGQLPIARNKLIAIRFDPELISVIKPPKVRYLLAFSDGSRITAASLESTGDMLQFQLTCGVNATIPGQELVELRRFSPTLEPLSQREPKSVDYTPFLTGNGTWKRDRNVLQGPLQIRGQEFLHGIGVRSRTTLVYEIEPQDREFRTSVGIDDAADGKGHVRFLVAVDGKTVWESAAITGASPTIEVPPVRLQGAKQLALTVDFGEYGDVRDYADWCEPIILRQD